MKAALRSFCLAVPRPGPLFWRAQLGQNAPGDALTGGKGEVPVFDSPLSARARSEHAHLTDIHKCNRNTSGMFKKKGHIQSEAESP